MRCGGERDGERADRHFLWERTAAVWMLPDLNPATSSKFTCRLLTLLMEATALLASFSAPHSLRTTESTSVFWSVRASVDGYGCLCVGMSLFLCVCVCVHVGSGDKINGIYPVDGEGRER